MVIHQEKHAFCKKVHKDHAGSQKLTCVSLTSSCGTWQLCLHVTNEERLQQRDLATHRRGVPAYGGLAGSDADLAGSLPGCHRNLELVCAAPRRRDGRLEHGGIRQKYGSRGTCGGVLATK